MSKLYAVWCDNDEVSDAEFFTTKKQALNYVNYLKADSGFHNDDFVKETYTNGFILSAYGRFTITLQEIIPDTWAN